MNWTEINKKYPKSFALWFEWAGWKVSIEELMEELDCLDIEEIGVWHDRNLYDFFDEKRIFITLKIVDQWDYTISDGKGHLLFTEYDFKESRKESEKAAFIKAFELLETQSS